MAGITYTVACTWETRGHNGPYERLPRGTFCRIIHIRSSTCRARCRSLARLDAIQPICTDQRGPRITRAHREPTRRWLALLPSALASRNFREKLGIELKRIR